MCGAPTSGDPQQKGSDDTVAGGGLVGIGTTTYAQMAARLLDNGYEPLPILPGTKRPAPSRWSGVTIDAAQVDDWSQTFGSAGIGLRTGHLVAVDVDLDDPGLAHDVAAHAEDILGQTLVRIGRWPRRLLIYRTLEPMRKMAVPGVEILGSGQQFVAFALQPGTGKPYEWVTGETPCDVALDQLPLVDDAALQRFLAFAAAKTGHLAQITRARQTGPTAAPHSDGPTRTAEGLVSDGRDGWLSSIAYHAVHDAVDQGQDLQPQTLADRVWDRFVATTDLARPRQDSGQVWSRAHALRKVCDKLKLRASGHLPNRGGAEVQPEDIGDLLPPDVARLRLRDAIENALAAASDWLSGDLAAAPPTIGIHATVGLGKSAVSRDLIAAWQRDMQAKGLPHRVLVVTPSHALAEEAATAWKKTADGPVAVLHGYDGKDPATRAPMCLDREMVKLALRESLSIGRSVCYSSKTWQCPHYDGCLKQQNKRDVTAAAVVLAPYDVLFTGPAAGSDPFGLIVIDEGCWQRSHEDVDAPPIEVLPTVGLVKGIDTLDPITVGRLADLAALRRQLASALDSNGIGQVRAAALVSGGLAPEMCEEAAALEERCIVDPNIYAGMKPRARTAATAAVKRNEIARRMMALWRALAIIIANEADAPVVRIHDPDPDTGRRRITIYGHHHIAESLRAIPILHLDATLRPDLAQVLLPGLVTTRIDAAQDHQQVTLFAGRFGKSSLCSAPGLAIEEQARRQNRLREVVDHVRWSARRMAPKRTLVVTYLAIEAAFQGIPGVETAHFNAIAGLDGYGDVGLLIVVGRPLPSTDDLAPLCASLFNHLPEGRYEPDLRAVHLRSDTYAVVNTLIHPDGRAEGLRAAICDDEVVQAIGRGRGVNRTAGNPLEVHVLADVALPLIHEQVVAWDVTRPDIVQRMLLAGIAVDSPADAAVLHSKVFDSADGADSSFRRIGFKRQNPICNSYRGMTLKSAAYRRSGRGRSWQIAYWLDGEADAIRARLERALGGLAEWRV